MELNLDEPDFFRDPYPYYAKIRASGKPLWLDNEQKTVSRGMWLYGRYADALSIFKQTSAISKNIHAIRPPGTSTSFYMSMLFRDEPDHMRLRRLVADYFSTDYVNKIKPHVLIVVDSLVKELQQKNGIDLISDFSEQVPLRVIARIMGVPESDMPQIRAWSLALAKGFDSMLGTKEVMLEQKAAFHEFLGYVELLIADKRSDFGDSLINFLIKAEKKGGIQREELIGMVGLLLFAGHETTINLIGNGLWLLMNHREQCDLLRQQPDLMPGAVEEILRFESPEQRTSFRVTVEPVDLAGVHMEPGQQIGIIIGSANRDERKFTDPDVFDIRRTNNRHLAFGLGIHNCLGKTLARLEANVAFSRILALCPSMHLLNKQPQWRKNSFFRGLESLTASLR